jgi:glucose/mannose-6-phosphate isomerase
MPEEKLSPQEIERFDTRRVYELYDGWPADVEEALRTQVDLPRKRYERVVYLAVGGSATGGDIISDWLLSSGGVPLTVYRGNVPRLNLENALVIVCSTSGDTRETLQMAAAMSKARPDMVAISSGGMLKEFAEREGFIHVKIRLTKAPRFTLPYSLFASVAALRGASLLEGMEWELDEAVKILKDTSRKIDRKVATPQNDSKQIAIAINGKVPCIYSTSVTRSVARRFKNSLNENAKILATYSAAPDFLHNEVEMWEKPDGKLEPVILRRTNDPPSETKAIDAFNDALMERGVKATLVSGSGRGNLAQLMSLCYTLDVASYYTAILRGVEPFSISLIEELKRAR